MDDLLNEIDRLHAKHLRKSATFGDTDRLSEVLVEKWPALRERLKAAERKAKAAEEETTT
jgi:hypothetical protein